MKNILMCLAFVVVSAMGETNYKIEKNEIETQLSQEERFNMLFGETTLQFQGVRESRTNRNSRNNRTMTVSRVLSEDEALDLSSLTQEEKYQMLFGETILTSRVARTSRLIFPRQARHNLFVSLNF